MENSKNICPSCFKKTPSDAEFCPVCGFDIKHYKHNSSALPIFTMLNDQFMIGRVLGQGGFGITYKAVDTFNSNRIVAIKEYMPSDYAERKGNEVVPLEGAKATRIFEHGKKSYIDEIKTLYQFKNVPEIVEIYQHFATNNTVYLVMEFLDGCSLKSYVTKNCGGKLDVASARNYIDGVARGLTKVHASNVLHRDISPENIYLINNAQQVKLIDFGAARAYIENSESEKSILLKPGFAPPEQYSRTGNQGPWTDVYALAATLYYIVSGKYVPESMQRMQGDTLEPLSNICPTVSKSMSNAVEKALVLDYKSRTQNCTQFINDLDQSGWRTQTIHTIVTDPINNVTQQPASPPPVQPMTPPVQPIAPHVQPIQPPQPPVQQFTPPPPTYVPPKTRQCVISCVQGPFAGRTFTMYPGQRITIGALRTGRPQICDFAVSSQNTVSKQHCVVEFDASRSCFFVTDISVNGTFTQSGQRLMKNLRTPMPPGSIVYLSQPDTAIIRFDYY